LEQEKTPDTFNSFQLQHDIAGTITLEAFVGDRRAGDIAAQVLQFLALIGAPAPQRTAAWRLKPCALARRSGADGLSALVISSRNI
jgi:hypothetical protein